MLLSSCLMREVNFLARSANLPEGLHILPMFIFIFKLLFNDQLLHLVSIWVRIINCDICLAVSQGTLLWQPVKFGGCSQTSARTTFAHCVSGVRQRMYKRLNGTNPATSCINLVTLHQIIKEFAPLKRAIFAAARPQFDDRPSFGTLAFRNGLEYRNFDFRN